MKKILYTLMLCLISAFAFAQEPAPPSPAKPFTAQFYVSTTGGDTTIYIYKVVQGVVYGWTRLAKSSETNLFVGRTLKGDGSTDVTPLNVNMDSTATAINNFLLAKNANGDIVPINANFSTDNNTIIFNGIKINANAGIILNPSIESGKDYFLKTDSINHMIVRDTNRYVPKYLGADFHLYNLNHKLIIDSVLFGTPTKNVQIREGSANFDAPGGRSAAFSAKEYGFFNGTSDTLYYFKAALVADTVRGVKELHYNRLFAMNAPVDTNEVANKKYVDSRPSVNIYNTNGSLTGDRTVTTGHVLTFLGTDGDYTNWDIFSPQLLQLKRFSDVSTATIGVSANGASNSSQAQLLTNDILTSSASTISGGTNGALSAIGLLVVDTMSNSKSMSFRTTGQNGIAVVDGINSIGFLYSADYYALGHLDSLWIPNWKAVKRYADSVSASGGGVTTVSGTTNRITSTGGTTPVIDISSTFEALLGKVANPLSQFASTTSAQLLGVISDESGTGALLFAGSPALTGTPTTPTATGATNTTQIASTAQVHLAIISDTSSVVQDRTGAQNQFSNLAGRIVTNTSNIATNTSNISANTTAIGLKQPRIVGNKPSATSTTYTTADSVTQVLSNLNSGIIANTASISGLGSTYLAKTDTAAMLANYIPKFVTSTIPSKKTFTAGIVSTFNTTSYSSIFPSQTQFYFVGQDANSAVLQGQSFAGHVVYEASRANGTAASPTAIIANDELGTYAYNGWDGTSYGEATASVQGTATQNFTSSAHGTQLIGNTTPNGSTTLTAAWVADQNGDFGVANNLAVGATLGANVSGYSSGSITATVLSKNNASGRAVLELVGPVLNTGNVAAEIDFDALSNTLQSNYKIARIYALPSGSTSGNRGGSINMSTKADNGVLAAFLTASNTQVVAFPHYTTNGGIFYGDGSGNLTQTGAGTSTTLLHGGTSPAYSAVSLTADVTGVLPVANIDTTTIRTVANSRTLAQTQTALNLKLNISDTTAMLNNVLHKNLNETILGLKTAQFNNIASTITPGFVIANNQVLTTGQAQLSPALKLSAPAFGTTLGTSQPVDWYVYSSGIAGTTPTGQLVFASGVGAATPGARVSFNTNASITAAGGNSVFTNNRTGIAATTTSGIISTNSTAATSGVAEQRAPAFESNGHVWNTTSTAADNVFGGRVDVRGISGTTPTAKMFWQMGTGVSTITYTDRMSLDNAGNLALLTAPATSASTYDILTRNTSTGVVEKVLSTSIPIIQGSADLTGQTAAGNVTTFTVGAFTATFNISTYINVTAVSVDVIQGQITYTDENNTAQTVSLANISAIGNSTYSPITIRAKNATVITVKTNLTTGAGSITFDTGARITQL